MFLVIVSYLFKVFIDIQGAIMAVGASKPTVVADADGFFSVKSKMLVSIIHTCMLRFYSTFIRRLGSIQQSVINGK